MQVLRQPFGLFEMMDRAAAITYWRTAASASWRVARPVTPGQAAVLKIADSGNGDGQRNQFPA
jgi:hypothetical protein